MDNKKQTDQEIIAGREMILDREAIIVRTSVIGIITNVLLAAFKAAIGLIANSIAVTLDAVNNLSDALSSIITIVGTKLAAQKPDRKHPMGHGRIEYISALIVAGIVLYAGITAGIESVKKIIYPQKPDYNTVSLIILAVAVVVKIVLGRYVKAQGQKVKSDSLIASGSDALFDAILSTSVLISAVIFVITGFSLEAWVGIAIALFIVKSGVEMVSETLDKILGARADKKLSVRIKQILNEEPEVRGAYDLIINNYGPDKDYASVHLELPDTMSVREVDKLTRKVEARVYKETGVILVGVGVYSYNTGETEAAEIENIVREKVMEHEWTLQMHGFYLDMEAKDMRFDVVMSFDIDPREGLSILNEEIQKLYPDYKISIAPDVDITD